MHRIRFLRWLRPFAGLGRTRMRDDCHRLERGHGQMADVKVFAKDPEDMALEQVRAVAALPPFERARIRVMPDMHAGKGCVIGLTCDTTEAVIPSIVGVDVGCGLLAWQLDETPSPELARTLDEAARAAVPTGPRVHDRPTIDASELAAYETPFTSEGRLIRSLGTLGGGNHFVEADAAPDGSAWLVVHSGSRGLGLQVAEHWQHVAEDDRRQAAKAERDQLVERLRSEGREREIQSALAALKARGADVAALPPELCWLTGEHRDGYLHDMRLAQDFADRNRRAMLAAVLARAGVRRTGAEVASTHNYIDLEHSVVRKGAIAAYAGQRVIIPLNMAAGCVIGTGRGNADWNFSAPHGAGRRLSRSAARRTLSMKDYEAQMGDVYSTSVCPATIDEAPQAYKDPSLIVSEIAPTVDVTFVMRPFWNFKDTSEAPRRHRRDASA